MNGGRQGAVDATTAAYHVGDVLPQVETLPRGSCLLVTGAAMSGKTAFAVDLLAAGIERGEHALVVTPDEGAPRLRSRFPTTDRLHVVDCSGTGGTFDDTPSVKYVSSAGDLTGIGIGIAKCTQAIGDRAREGVRLAVLSLSTVLRYTSLDSLFNFVHVLTGRIEAAGYLGVFTLDPTVHDATTVNTIKAQVDGVVELREGEAGDREVRVTGLDGATGEWTPR